MIEFLVQPVTSTRFRLGDRVVVAEHTQYPEIGGCYGHVVENTYGDVPIVTVNIEGRINGKPVAPDIWAWGPWPIREEELHHVD
jgi:hypothetical protein